MHIRQILCKNTYICVPLNVKKTHVLIIASLTLKVTLWGNKFEVFIGPISHSLIEIEFDIVAMNN